MGGNSNMAMAVWQTMGVVAERARSAIVFLIRSFTNEPMNESMIAAQSPVGASRRALAWITAVVLSLGLTSPAAAQDLPDGFSIETVASGMVLPVAFDRGVSGMYYVAEKRGSVAVIDNGQLLTQRFLDISNKVNTNSDRGMLGIAVHPDFPSSPYVYVLYTYDPPEVFGNSGPAGPDGAGNRVSRLSRFTADASTGYRQAVAGSELVLLGTNSVWANIGSPGGDYSSARSCEFGVNNYIEDCLPIDELSHTIGDVRFAPDGALIVSSGDGASYHSVVYGAVRAQHLDSLAGKLLRIDPATGNGLPDNPHYNGDPSANRSKVWSFGLRNPFRFTLHPTTGEPAIGDVGWANWEEINIGSDKNFGWPCYEGANGFNAQQQSYASYGECQNLYNVSFTATAPAYAYDHLGLSASVQIGDYYSGQKWPSRYRGALFFSDINRSVVEYVTFNSSGAVSANYTFATDIGGIAQMKYANDGDIYFLNLYSGSLQIFRYDATNEPPVVVLDNDVSTGTSPLVVQFNGSSSFDPEGEPLDYFWEFGDGSTSSSANPSHTFTTPGDFFVRLTVTDVEGVSRSDTTAINVDNLPPTITLSTNPGATLYRPGQWVALSATATDPDEGTLNSGAISWDAELLHADHVHPNFFAASGANTGFQYPDHGDDTRVRVCAIATDSGGLTDEICDVIKPQTVQYTLNSVPDGQPLTFNGQTRNTPFTVTTVIGGSRTLSASAVNSDGTTFDRWSDGGAMTHVISIGTQPTTITAFFDTQSDTDGDGVLNSEEIIWGTDFLVPDTDTDSDGTPDFIDSNPASASDSGFSLYLEPGVKRSGNFGHQYGDSEYYSRLRVAFENPATDVLLSVTGWNVSPREIGVKHSRNGQSFTKFTTLQPGNNKVVLTSSQLASGRNWVDFVSRTPGQSWGLSKVKLLPISSPTLEPLVIGTNNYSAYGKGVGDSLHPWLVRTSFGWVSGPHELRFKLYNQTEKGQVAVYLNGTRIYESAAATADKWTGRITVPLPTALITGQNVVEFVTRGGKRAWGVKKLLVRPVP